MRKLLFLGLILVFLGSTTALAEDSSESEKTMETAMAFMGAMTGGDMETMIGLMHEDMVWQNEGDLSVPWIGPWEGKQTILEDFLPVFGAGFQTLKWESEDAFASGDTAAFFGKMIGRATNTEQETNEFTWALRVKVKDGQIILWNWFEDSYQVSKAYHGIGGLLEEGTSITLRNTLQDPGEPEVSFPGLFELPDNAFDEFATLSYSSTEFTGALAQEGTPFGDISGLYGIDFNSDSITFTLLPDSTDPFWPMQFGVFPEGKFDRYYFTFSENHNVTASSSNDDKVSLRIDSDKVLVVELSGGYDFNPGKTFKIDLHSE